MSMFTIKKWLSKKATILGVVAASIAIIGGVVALSSNNNAKAATLYPCDSNEVIDCGVTGGIGQLKTDYDNSKNLQAIYASSPFDMSYSDMQNFFATAQPGWVYSNGNVTIGSKAGGQTVATGALTAGRDSMKCDSYSNGLVYVRPTSCSFLSSPLQAFIYMPNGEFKFAVLLSCGNPVVATSIPPIYTCDALDARRILNDPDSYTELAQVHVTTGNGATFQSVTYEWGDGTSTTYTNTLYKLHTYKDAGNYTIRAHVTYLVNGVTVSPDVNLACIAHVSFAPPIYTCDALDARNVTSTGLYTELAQVHVTTGNGASFKSVSYEWGDGNSSSFTNTLAQEHTYKDAGDYTIRAHVTYLVNGVLVTPDVNLACIAHVSFAQPEFACTGLTVTPTKDEDLSATAVVTYTSAHGAVFKSVDYTWGDGTTTNKSPNTTETHSYSKAGNYTITASINYTADGQTLSTPASDCTGSINFTQPMLVCTGLDVTATKNESLSATAVVTYKATNGAKFKSVTYTWGDGTTTKNTPNTTETHAYTKYGNYTITASITYTADGKTFTTNPASNTSNCTSRISFTAPECTDLALTQVKGEDLTVQAVTTYSAGNGNGITYDSVTYNWNDGKATTVKSANTEATHTYTTFGQHSVDATVNFTVNGKAVAVTANDCDKTITLAKPSTPTFACTTMNIDKDDSNLSVQAVTSFTDSNGATFKSLTYDWGDNTNSGAITTTSNTNTVVDTHTYSQAGTYTITASIVFVVNGVAQTPVSSAACQEQINFPTPTPMCTIPGETTLPASSPQCTPMCTVPGETTLPASSPQCVTPVSTTLPNTGPGNVIGIFGLTTVLGTAGHYLYRRRFGSKSV